jgi:transcriptional regulator with XRE-family HTH domain
MTQARDEALLAAFASVLKDIRKNCGLSQEQLALRAGVDRTFVGKLESGKNQPSLAVLFKLAHASSVNPEDFVKLIRSRIEDAKATC